jgi:amidase
MVEDYWRWSAIRTARAVRDGEVSAEAVTSSHLRRMAEANPDLNAVVVDLSEQARATAHGLDRARAAGRSLGPLAGVPVTIKINVDVEGQANSNGVTGLAHVIAPGDAPVVANLRAAGAVILGMTNTPEFSLRGFTDNPLHGQTYNPWDPAITCGGSSGGAGAAVAAGIGAVAHGNDIGGSLRTPAFCNGVSTIKPTLGRTPAYNPSASAERPPMAQLMSVQGPLCREVADVRLALEVMSGRDVRDPWWAPAPLTGPPAPRRIARARIPTDIDCDDEVMAGLDAAARHLADAGYEVVETDVPDITEAFQLWADLIATEIHAVQIDAMREMGSPPFIGALEGLLSLGTPRDIAGYIEGVAYRARLLRRWLEFLETCPVVLAPVSVQPTWAFDADLKGLEAVRRIFHNDLRFNVAISVLGLPSAVTPVGFARGAPVGVQLIGSRYREDLCLAAAEAIEARVGVLAHQLWARG